jgi:hypothetical protein
MSTQAEIKRLKTAVKKKEHYLVTRSGKGRSAKMNPPDPYRSWFEVDIAIDALERDIPFDYELHHIIYREPETVRKYKPDYFVRRKTDGTLLIVEAKGRWTAQDRKKMCYVTEQNPDLDIRILFERDNRLSKSKRSMTYTAWCTKKGIGCAVGRSIPQEWMEE